MNKSNFATPEDAEHSFYQLIIEGDADKLMLAWSDEEDSVCVHPTGVCLTGLLSIRESWRSIFATARILIEAESVAHWQISVVAVHHLTELL